MIDLEVLPIRVGLGQFSEITTERLQFIKQCGVDDFQLNTPQLPGQEHWQSADLSMLVQQGKEVGLRLFALENVPNRFYDKIMLGLPGREEQLRNMCQTVRNMGHASIPILGYHFMPCGVWRTSQAAPARGGATVTSFNLQQAICADPAAADEFRVSPSRSGNAERVYTDEEMWENYNWYLERILPVCEEAGVRLALHPDDPPVNSLGGIARIFRNVESFRQALETFDSPMHGLDFCHGCFSEMRGGAEVLEAIRFFGRRGKIFYVHFRDVQGAAQDFTECFLGDGNCNPIETVRTLKQVGFHGVIIPDHVPRMIDDTDWCHRGRAWTIGYIKALLEVLIEGN